MQVEVDDRICPGCKQSAISDSGGLVVAFGSSFFHVDCFKCAKCGDKVTADTNLLLLSDGSPICANCSYCCNVCHQPILDEAIMTGDDSYHAHCFKCKVCKSKIDELVFAKTSQGIYCMNCHNDRMIKIRKHAQKKAEREKAERERAARERLPPEDQHGLRPSPYRSTSDHSRTSPQRDDPSNPTQFANYPMGSPAGSATASPAPQVMVSRPPVFSKPVNQAVSSPTEDGVRANNLTVKTIDEGSDSSARRAKRRSINPGLVLANPPASPPTSPPGASLSPASASFAHRSQGRSTPPVDSQPSSPHSRPSSSSQGHGDIIDNYSRSRTLSTPDTRNEENTVVVRPPLRTSSTTESVPSQQRGKDASRQHDSASRRSSSQNLAPSRSRSVSRTRSPSPSHTADVPHSIESGTDTDDGDHYQPRRTKTNGGPPPPPPKENGNAGTPAVDGYPADPDSSLTSPDSVEDYSESTPLERVSHSTFIAPALPPIRFSLSNGDFSEMFRANGGVMPNSHMQSLKTLEHLAKLTESAEPPESYTPASPPPSAASDATVQALAPSHEPASFRSESSTTLNASLPEEDGSTEDVRGSESSHERSTPISKLTRKLSKGRKRNNKETKENSPDSVNGHPPTKITISAPLESSGALSVGLSGSKGARPDPTDLVMYRLKQALTDAKDRGAQQLRLEPLFVEAIVQALEAKKADYVDLKSRFDGIRRTSKQYIDGLTVAQAEYDKELKARRDAEAEVTRLRVLLSGQAVRLTTLASDSRRQEMHQQMSKDLKDNLSGLEHDLSKLKAERDMTLAEVEELSANKSSDASAPDNEKRLGRSLTMRLDGLKVQYERDLVPLIAQRETLSREIQELKGVREMFLEETTVLNARNEELAQLSAQYARRMEMTDTPIRGPISRPSTDRLRSPPAQQTQFQQQPPPSVPSSGMLEDDTMKPNRLAQRVEQDATPSKAKFMNWPSRSASKPKDISSPMLQAESVKQARVGPEHNFQQLSVLRFTRCDHCGDKMWGSQLRCTACNISIHVRCVNHVSTACSSQNGSTGDDGASGPLLPSMFGRDLSEQVRADGKGGDRRTPVIVDKCIEAVEALAMEYEGIYRKTGGSSQSKAITQLFERGDYNSFDLRDTDRFNDICSVTSVLKTYFRSLPDPLLTYDLHDQFMTAVELRDPANKNKTLLDLVNKLPDHHYFTLRSLMLHLHGVCERHEKNLMTSRNLGVVFGPTLMRSRDPAAEFSDMAGKALTIEWLVENATLVFTP